MTLSLIPEVFNPINVISLICEKLGVIDSHVAEIAHVESIVGLERIGIDDTVGLDLLLYDRQESSCSGVWNDGRVDLPPLLSRPKTATLPAAPRPRLPLRRPPK